MKKKEEKSKSKDADKDSKKEGKQERDKEDQQAEKEKDDKVGTSHEASLVTGSTSARSMILQRSRVPTSLQRIFRGYIPCIGSPRR